MLDRGNVRAATPQSASPTVVAPQPSILPAGADQETPSRRSCGPAVLTPGNGGRIVAMPPAREIPKSVVPMQAMPSSTTPQTYGGVPASRGAYTGVPPTPGPKAPVVVDRGITVPATVQSLPHRAPVTPGVPATPLAATTQQVPHGAPRDAAVAHPTGLTRSPPSGVAAATASAPPPNRKSGTRPSRLAPGQLASGARRLLLSILTRSPSRNPGFALCEIVRVPPLEFHGDA
jgi:hypothetical protein